MHEDDGARLIQFFPDGIEMRISEIEVSNLSANAPTVRLTWLLRCFPNEFDGFRNMWQRQESEATWMQLFVNVHELFRSQCRVIGMSSDQPTKPQWIRGDIVELCLERPLTKIKKPFL